MKVKFGTAGSPERFYDEGHKSTIEIPQWLSENNLDAFEVQCGRGVKFSKESAQRLGENASHYNIALSVHSPYYINISTKESEKRENGFRYIMETAEFARIIRAERIVVHMGSFMNATRLEALELSKDFMRECLERLDKADLGDIHLCPETMGKINQMGTVDEVLGLCRIDERLIPTIDFGHVNSREQGSLKTLADYDNILNNIENKLGNERLKKLHVHFSKIEYTKGGEKKHLTLSDEQFGPPFEPLAEAMVKRNLSPVIICESDGTQADDAMKMKQIWSDFYEIFGN